MKPRELFHRPPSRKATSLALLFGLPLAALALSHWLWLRQPYKILKVMVVDKTVSDATRREHSGLFWVLNHRKIRPPSGEDYLKDRDYYGFFPLRRHRWAIQEPSLTQAKPELIYLADTYGVYSEEFYGKALGNRTDLIYGGLRPEELRDLEGALPGCLTLVGEFNTFANPTEGEPRLACERLFGLHWGGWIGRFFPNLEREVEVPPWAVRNYERQTGKEWLFEGPGFLLVSEEDQVEVLEEGVDVEAGRGLRLRARPAGRKSLELPWNARYDYWFDLVQPRPGTEVLADYELPLLPPGERRLKAIGLGRWTPAILSGWQGGTHTYYFAGDFADAWPPPNFTRLQGFAEFRRATTREVPGDYQSFYWRVFVPMLTRILQETQARKR